jgi:hypothetical protein
MNRRDCKERDMFRERGTEKMLEKMLEKWVQHHAKKTKHRDRISTVNTSHRACKSTKKAWFVAQIQTATNQADYSDKAELI